MIIIRDPTLTSAIDDPGIRSLVETRFAQILAGETYDYDRHGYMIVVEPGDSIADLEQETQCSILHNFFDETHYGHPDFTPSFEALEDHGYCFEMVFIMSDSGFGIEIFLPKHGIDTDLLKLCTEYAVPATAKLP